VSDEQPFDIVRVEYGDTPELVVYGELDVMTAPRLHEALRKIIAEAPSGIIVDLANVTFLDSSGLSVLVVAHRHLTENGATLRLVAVPDAVRRVFTLAGLDARFHIYDNRDDAAQAVPPVSNN
jgi:anti-anti-sigma factor